ncbi:high-affinity zinc uptake system protein znuA [Alcanivorax nanhaiticus]|uniref:High-affinity zinc uptake system protein ZnuA n=1 Tax=Alcanivorax nanhaiticus TaxID=1177154 RepID=A0A095SGK9_9GAMM|nr:metal ABC transporter substrate-binding protein [Alcanivorax nanhaiticus]KGD63746.1 high-affinity zinc uptake system protein znuA [Alcanivorax nanhaiticus]
MRRFWLTTLLMLCSPAWSQTIVASVEPLAKVVRSLYGPQVEVVTLLQANQNPHQLALSPRQALLVQQADLMVWLGAEVEAPLSPLVARRDKRSVALLDVPGVERRESGTHHDHDGHEHHDHGGAHAQNGAYLDPHLWLSVDNMILLSRAVVTALPEGLESQQPEAWQARAVEIQSQWRSRLAVLAQRPWLTYHHPWGYFTDALGLAEPVVVSQQLDAGPGSRRFVVLAAEIRERDVQCMIREPEAREAMLKRLCADCRVEALDPLGRDQPTLNYLDWLDYLGAGFERCLKGAN